MDIGTAKPSSEELSEVKHHFINNLSIHDEYNIAQYEKEAITLLEQLFQQKDVVVLVGGSGLYVNALCYGIDDIPSINTSTRNKVNTIYKNDGIEGLRFMLHQLDKKSYQAIDTQNPRRVMRALEVYLQTNKSIIDYQHRNKKSRKFSTIFIGLNLPRQDLYENINKRVDLMIKKGLIEEAKKLFPLNNQVVNKTVGYKEIFEYLNKNISIEEATEKLKKNSRNYAKRQITWFKKNDQLKWYTMSTSKSLKNIKTDLILKIDHNFET